MRFLLKHTPLVHQASRGSLDACKKVERTPCFESLKKQNTNLTKAWGQQCSPNCGCAIRFEVNMSPDHGHQIMDATYHAVQVVSSLSLKESPKSDLQSRNEIGKRIRQPITTNRTAASRPILKTCTCTTLHKLASEIVSRLPTLTLAQAQNQLEFSGVRSPNSFRYTVLRDILSSIPSHTKDVKNPKWIQRYTPCYDLVEEAIIACLKGYMPKPRRTMDYSMYTGISRGTHTSSHEYEYAFMAEPDSISSQNWVSHLKHAEEMESYSFTRNDHDLDPLRYVRAAKRRFALSFPTDEEGSVDTIPAFHLYPQRDSVYHGQEEDVVSLSNKAIESKEPTPKDWVSYVDEMNESFDRKAL